MKNSSVKFKVTNRIPFPVDGGKRILRFSIGGISVKQWMGNTIPVQSKI